MADGFNVTSVLSYSVLNQAAVAIADQHRHSLPRLDSLIVLLPSHQVIPEFISLLAKHAAAEHLVLPRITTLADWAASYPLKQNEISNGKRQSLIYRILK